MCYMLCFKTNLDEIKHIMIRQIKGVFCPNIPSCYFVVIRKRRKWERDGGKGKEDEGREGGEREGREGPFVLFSR